MRYEDGQPIEIEKILISTQHKPGVDSETLIKPDLWEHVLHPILPAELFDEKKLSPSRTSSSTRPASSRSAARWATAA